MKIGDYVRTNDEKIFKIKEQVELEMLNRHNGDDRFVYAIKSSPNIIDLIEVGDYVNGCPVLLKENNELVCGLLLRYKEENIENIVTKGQFESMEYKVDE